MKYYVFINNQQQGPVEESQLLSLGVTRDTLVWHEGMSEWVAAGSLPELGYLFNSQSAPLQQATMPKNYLVHAILCTIFCFWPTGIPAIINAAGVSSAWARGDYQLAEAKSRNAWKWVKISFFVGLGIFVIYFTAVMAFVITDLLSSSYY